MNHHLFVSLAVVACAALAQDKAVEWPEGSAMQVGSLEVQRRDAAERLLATAHTRLLALVQKDRKYPDERTVQALKAQHAAWLKYRVDECELVGALSGAGGTWPSTYAVRCEANLTEQRHRRVASALRCIDKIPAEKREFELNRCLYQLGPLTYGR